MPTSGDIYYFDSNFKHPNTDPVIVLFHGAGGFHLHWPSKIRRIPGYRVLAPDLPGHGNSGGLGEQTIAGYAKKIIKWLDDIGVGRAIFVGHSMGGAIVQKIALDYADYVLGAILVSTGATLPVNDSLLEMFSIPGEFDAAMDLVIKWVYSKKADPKLIEEARKHKNETRPTVVYGDYLACKAFDASERAYQINAPVLVVCGEEDKMMPPQFSIYLASQINEAKLAFIPDAGHMVMLEQENELAKVMGEFLFSINK